MQTDINIQTERTIYMTAKEGSIIYYYTEDLDLDTASESFTVSTSPLSSHLKASHLINGKPRVLCSIMLIVCTHITQEGILHRRALSGGFCHFPYIFSKDTG